MPDTPPQIPSSPHAHGAGVPLDRDLKSLLERLRAGDRQAAAAFVSQNEHYIRRRVRGKLGTGMRRMCDSQDVFSTVARRLDRLVLNRHLSAEDAQQLWSLIHRITDTALIDKINDHTAQPSGESIDRTSEIGACAQPCATPDVDSHDQQWMEQLFAAAGGEVDRQILAWWLADVPLFRIAQHLQLTPGAVRARWSDIRKRIRISLCTSGDVP